jgi:DNA-binding beta-propeller fold protein YncE
MASRTLPPRLLIAFLAIAGLLLAAHVGAAATGDLELRSCVANAAITGQQCQVHAGLLDGLDGVQVSPDGRNAYAVAFSANAIAVFDRDSGTGDLTLKAGAEGCVSNAALGQCTVESGLLQGPDGVRVSPDGKSVYVTSWSSGTLTTFDRDPVTGALSLRPGPEGCFSNAVRGSCTVLANRLNRAGAVTVSPDGTSVYAVSSTPGSEGIVAAFSRDTVTGALTFGMCTSSRAVADCATGGSGVFALDPRTANLVVSPDGHQVYLNARFGDAQSQNPNGSVVTFDRDGSTGALTLRAGAGGCIADAPLGPCRVLPGRMASPVGLSASPDGRNVYVSVGGSAAPHDVLVTLTRDPATGALDPLAAPGGCLASDAVADCGILNPPGALLPDNFDPRTVLVTPDGMSAYVSSVNWNMVLAFDRNPLTGALSPRSGASGCLAQVAVVPCAVVSGLLAAPRSLAISPDGQSLYAPAVGGGGGGIASIASFGFARAPAPAPETNAAPAPVPARAFSVGRRTITLGRRSVTLRNVVTLSTPGTVRISVRRATRGPVLCSRTGDVRTVGPVTLTCVMGPSVRASLRRRATPVLVSTTFTPVGGVPVSSSAWFTLPRRR